MKLSGKVLHYLCIKLMLLLMFSLVTVSGLFLEKAEASTTTLGDLAIGTRVFDSSWVWQFRTGNNYTYQTGDGTDAVVWIVVAKNHYGTNTGVTLLSEDLIGRFYYANTRFTPYDYPPNLWSVSELYKWLNSASAFYPSPPGFKAAFSDHFKSKMVTTGSYPNYWPDLPNFPYYNMDLSIFIPSTTELGDTAHISTVPIGSTYQYFSGAGNTNANRIAKLKGVNTSYWTRSPYYPPLDSGEHIHLKRILSGGGIATTTTLYTTQSIGVRPVLNLRSDTICIPAGAGLYKILNPPQKVALKSPTNNANAGGTSITLQWNPAGENQWEEDMITYELAALGGNQLFKIFDITGNSYTIDNLPDNGTTFTWMVRAYNPAGIGEWSEQWTFINGSVNPVTLKSPAHNANVVGTRAVFKWNAASGATRYQLQVRKTSDNSIFKNLTLGKVTQRAIADFPADGTQYRWRVRAGNASDWGQWSAYRQFKNPFGVFNHNFNTTKGYQGWIRRPQAVWNLNTTAMLTAGQANRYVSARRGNVYYQNLDYSVRLRRTNSNLGEQYLLIRAGTKYTSDNLWHPGYGFGYRNNGTYRVLRLNNDGTITQLKGWTASDSINKNGWNTLRVRAVNNNLRYIINGTLVYNANNSAFARGTVGVMMFRRNADPASTRLLVDWAKMSNPAASSAFEDEMFPLEDEMLLKEVFDDETGEQTEEIIDEEEEPLEEESSEE